MSTTALQSVYAGLSVGERLELAVQGFRQGRPFDYRLSLGLDSGAKQELSERLREVEGLNQLLHWQVQLVFGRLLTAQREWVVVGLLEQWSNQRLALASAIEGADPETQRLVQQTIEQMPQWPPEDDDREVTGLETIAELYETLVEDRMKQAAGDLLAIEQVVAAVRLRVGSREALLHPETEAAIAESRQMLETLEERTGWKAEPSADEVERTRADLLWQVRRGGA